MSNNEAQDEGPFVNGIGGPAMKEKHRMALCVECKSLNLSADRFIVDEASSIPAKGVRNPYLPQPDPIHVSDLPPMSTSSKKDLGALGKILDKSETCPFCSLVIKSITDPQDDTNLPACLPAYLSSREAICYVNWEIDGREAVRGPDGLKKSHSYLVFVAPERYYRPNSDAKYVWGDEALFLGRDIDTKRGIRALIKSWLDLCLKSHGGQCQDARTVERHSDFGDMISQSYFGVIDVYNVQLTSLPYHTVVYLNAKKAGDASYENYVLNDDSMIWHEPYVALSHVWGKGKSYTTTLENIMFHRNHGGLEQILADIPVRHVFRDAMEIVRGLGIRYLWIDSLCIVQNSTRSWKLNARVMDLIYGNARLTICAADGQDSYAGLRAMHTGEHENRQYVEDCVPGVRLMVSRPPETGIETSNWDKRAWTFQERLLSKRCLIFTEGRVYFQCLSTGMSQDIVADKQGAGWSLDLVRAPLQTLRELERRALWVYASFVPRYTNRNLTEPGDILAAFNGICNRMRETLQAPFIFGLPSSHFDLALLWEPERALHRRRPNIDGEKKKAKYTEMVFPSWSWCGWTGGKMEYKPSMVEGSLANLHEWLIKHTWIHWYIRNGHGNLRPLWDGEMAVEDKSSETRWRGYKSSASSPPRRPRELGLVSHRHRSHGDDSYDAYAPPPRPRELGSVSHGHRSHGDDSYDAYAPPPRPRELGSVSHGHRSHGDDSYDAYGRTIRKEITSESQDEFRQTLPENPYHVVMSEYCSEPDKEFPDQPILQFWTWHTFLHLVSPNSPVSAPETGLCRYDIADQIGDWCGSLVLDEKWINDSGLSRHEFIAISDAKAFTHEECDVWTYYIPKERDQSEWDLFYVLLVERKNVKWERVALGKVFKTAFANSVWKEIILG